MKPIISTLIGSLLSLTLFAFSNFSIANHNEILANIMLLPNCNRHATAMSRHQGRAVYS